MVNYAIVGGGRLARHFSQYFHLLDIPHTRWARDETSSFNTFEQADAEKRLLRTVARTERVLLLVSDGAIAAVLERYPFLHQKQLVHCSGALSFPGVTGAHPLMTFTDRLYEIDTYLSVPFMLEAGYSFDEVLPGLPNPHFAIKPEDKASYHAMCVLAGNFSQVLWEGISDRFQKQFGLPAKTLHPYLKQVAGNFIEAPGLALTGPLTRNDQETLERNLGALEGDGLQDLYRAFVHFYQNKQTGHPVPGQTPMEQAQMEQII